MLKEGTKITAGLRFWSDGYSLKGIAARFPGRVEYLYDIGEPLRVSSGELSMHNAEQHYLALKEYETYDLTGVPALVKRCLDELRQNGHANSHVLNSSLETVLWISVFGERKIEYDALGINPLELGRKIGLVVENYTAMTEAGQPERCMIEACILNHNQNMEA